MFTTITRGSPRRAVIAFASLAGIMTSLTVGADSAGAALIESGSCPAAAPSQPFARWGDQSSYELVPGGDFEGSLAGWTLSAGAAQTAGSEPYAASGTAGKYSLLLGAGSSALSPAVCVDASEPTFRLLARNNGLLSTVAVQVVYPTLLGPVALPLGAVALSPSWKPTLSMLTGSVAGALVSNGTTQMSLRFTAVTGTSQIDDVYVDPRGTR